ncbi:MAG: pyridoxal phosphate-dependent aminotransferase [Patescibacteria group bacterium]|nr:pyridoxal phosphate-dependent aminotransferase [Patescibacteria group bacterium]
MAKLVVSKRGRDVIASPIRKFLPFMQATEKKGIKVYKINVGDPDLQPPQEFFKVIRHYAGKTLGYTPSPGIPAHTAAWQKYFKQFGVSLPMSGIVPTVGCAEAILLAMQAVCDPGDELLVFEPLYSSYKSFSVMTNIKLVPILLPFDKNFAVPSAAEIEKKITKRTKAVVVINPDNPTGKLWSEAELNAVVKVAKKHNLFIIADETYREIRFDGKKPASLLANKAARQHVIVCDSASKRFTMPGARTGCVASFNEEVMQTILKFAQARLSTPTLEQLGLVPVLNNSRPYVSKIVKEYRKRRDTIAAGLSKIPGVKFKPAKGAIYQALQLPFKDTEKFVRFMISEFNYKGQTVMVTPMQDFYITPNRGRNEIRVAYVLNSKDLAAAMEVLKRGVEAYRKKYNF